MPVKCVTHAESDFMYENFWFDRYLKLFQIFGIYVHKSVKHKPKNAHKNIFQIILELFWAITIYYHIVRIYDEFQDVSRTKN